jgi:hypothetical protein
MKPIKTPINEEERLNEIKRLVLINTDVNNNRNFNNITQLACYLTGRTQSRMHFFLIITKFIKIPMGLMHLKRLWAKTSPGALQSANTY